MKIVAVSDLHGYLPPVPPCDLLLLAGDLCPRKEHREAAQAEWLDTHFRRWLEQAPARQIVGVAGNHDFIFQTRRDLVPAGLPWTYLQDSGTTWEGLNLWGSPWQPWFFDWAFNLYEPDLVKKWALIPAGTDVLLLHGPPFGYGDGAYRGSDPVEHTGSPGLLDRIRQVAPRLVVFGHIHEGRGQWQLGPTVLANVSVVNERYELTHPPWEFELTR
ncbi:MAG: metallophosphoesterase [Gemmataceae bacterium]